MYEEYLTKVKEFITRTVDTAVHERRRDDLTEDKESWQFANLHRQVNHELERTDVKILSLQWLRCQFWPSLKNSANAKHMTCKNNIKYMVQRRLLRKSHINRLLYSKLSVHERVGKCLSAFLHFTAYDRE